MNQRIRLKIGLMLVVTMAACSPSQPPTEPEAAQPPEGLSASAPVAESPVHAPVVAASTTASGSMVVYACEDGSGVTVTYDKYNALVKLPAGSTMLSRAESASGGGSDAYLGEELSLYRNGNLVQLQVDGKTRACTETPTGG
jgi:hypothetical protein